MKPTKPGTKTDKVLTYLKSGHSLDFPKAIGLWGHIRLSDVIHRLRKKGWPIYTQIVKNGDVAFAIYRLSKTPTRQTPAGTCVKVIHNALTDYGKTGRISFGNPTPFEVLIYFGGTKNVPFDFNELEIV